MATKYTLSEVAKHKSKDDLWFVIHGKVYDVTKFGDDHPGGFQALVDEAGTDATNPFEDIGHSEDAKQMLAQYYIGDLEVESVAPTVPAASIVPPFKEDPATVKATEGTTPTPSSSPAGFFSNPIVTALLIIVPITIGFAVGRRYLK